MGGHFRILLQIAVRNLFASALNLVIGGIILVGTCWWSSAARFWTAWTKP